ncbi:MAG: ABC transporter permease [Flexilinea sp.]
MNKKKNILARVGSWILSQNTIIAFLLLFTVASIMFSERNFFSLQSIQNILRKAACDGGIVAMGMAFVILTGQIDLSVGSILAMSAIVCAMIVNTGNTALGIIAGLATGLVCGLANGFMVAKMKISSWIATLAMMLALRGGVYLITNQRPITIENEAIIWLGKTKILGGFNILIFIYFAIVLICAFISKNTKFGMGLYAVGGNEEAAKMMGLKVDSIKIRAFAACGLLCAIAGILLSGRLRTAQATAGEMWETMAIAGCALGGVKLTGGEGKFTGVLFGTMIIVVINTLFNYAPGINTWWQNILMGVLVMLSVALQSDNLKIKFRKRKK